MNRIKSIIRDANLTTKVFPFSPFYTLWEIDEIIWAELYQNLGLATLAIYFATLVLLSDCRGSLFCLLSVVLTLTNVSGFMHFWGLAIEPATSTLLIICVGLTVDFSAHIVHSFMQTSVPRSTIYSTSSNSKCQDIESSNPSTKATKQKNANSEHDQLSGKRFNVLGQYCDGVGVYNIDKKRRMIESLQAVAPAVLYGGLSTLLAVILLSFSDIYIFTAFFKIFLLVVLFGLFNGLVMLPVLLSNLGPNERITTQTSSGKSAAVYSTIKGDLPTPSHRTDNTKAFRSQSPPNTVANSASTKHQAHICSSNAKSYQSIRSGQKDQEESCHSEENENGQELEELCPSSECQK